MKPKFHTIHTLTVAAFILTMLLTACEQTDLEPKLNAAPGGGTLTAYKAYTLDSIPGTGRIYGRIVFWKDNVNRTLVQVSVYNTTATTTYPAALYSGAAEGGSTTSLLSLYAIDGTKGEFSTYKYYVIESNTFYSTLDNYDAHLSIFSGTTLVATGDVGKNATPVETK